MRRWSLETVVFLSGASVMIVELTGSRMLAPYLGTSIFVWTSLIGVILASLSLGYWWGGRLADRRPRVSVLALILAGAAVWVGALAVWNDSVLIALMTGTIDVRTSSVIAAVALFAVPGVLMGMVSPYAVRLKMSTVDRSGRTVGNLYAISTVGSIIGTFLAGFVLVATMSNSSILVLVAATLLAASLLTSIHPWLAARVAAVLVLAGLAWARPAVLGAAPPPGVLDVNTLYSRVWIYDRPLQSDTGETVMARFMRIGNEYSGAMFHKYWEMVYPYTDFFRLVGHFKPDFRTSLMIGGGAYVFPLRYLHDYPDARMDVVEIDPGITELARRYFWLTPDPRLRIFHEDGRVYLNRSHERYDALFIDAFRSHSCVPPHLVTREAVQAMADALVDDGVVIVNLICVIEGHGSELFRAIHGTFASVFPRVLVFPVRDPDDPTVKQNVILVGLRSPKQTEPVSDDSDIERMLSQQWTRPVAHDLPVLRDDFSPVEHYVAMTMSGTSEPITELLDELRDMQPPTPN